MLILILTVIIIAIISILIAGGIILIDKGKKMRVQELIDLYITSIKNKK